MCCVTVAFCSNLLMVQDRISGARRDLTMTPVRRSTLALGYFAASALSTLLICYAALAVCLLATGIPLRQIARLSIVDAIETVE